MFSRVAYRRTAVCLSRYKAVCGSAPAHGGSHRWTTYSLKVSPLSVGLHRLSRAVHRPAAAVANAHREPNASPLRRDSAPYRLARYHPLSPFHLRGDLSTCFPVSLSTCFPLSLSPCLPVYLFPPFPVSLFPCFPVSLSPCLPVSPLPCLPVSLSPCLPVSLFTCLPSPANRARVRKHHKNRDAPKGVRDMVRFETRTKKGAPASALPIFRGSATLVICRARSLFSSPTVLSPAFCASRLSVSRAWVSQRCSTASTPTQSSSDHRRFR